MNELHNPYDELLQQATGQVGFIVKSIDIGAWRMHNMIPPASVFVSRHTAYVNRPRYVCVLSYGEIRHCLVVSESVAAPDTARRESAVPLLGGKG